MSWQCCGMIVDEMNRIVLVVFVLYVLCGCQLASSLRNHFLATEYHLVNELLDGYLPSVRPKRNSRGSVEVVVGFDLYALRSMEEKAETMSIVGWFYLVWNDEFMVWDPTQYDNINSILVPSDRVWLPDIAFVNGADKLFYDVSPFRVLADSNGSMLFQPGGPMSLSCIFNLMYYPFDVHMCKVVVISWSTTEDKMRLKVDKLYLDGPIENGEWRVVDTGQYGESLPFPGGNYSQLTFKVLLRRKPQYQVVNVVIPIITLPFLNLVVFYLPPKSGEKISLSITVLLAFSVWLLMMTSITPTSSDNMPVVAICTVMFMALSTISVIVSVLVVHLYHNDEPRDIPLWSLKLLQCHRHRREKHKQTLPPSGADCVAESQFTWKDVASAVDSTAFYCFLVIIVAVIVIGAATILIHAPQQSAMFYSTPSTP